MDAPPGDLPPMDAPTGAPPGDAPPMDAPLGDLPLDDGLAAGQHQHGWDTAHNATAFGLHPHAQQHPDAAAPPEADAPLGDLSLPPPDGGAPGQHQHGWDTAHNATAFGLHPHGHPDAGNGRSINHPDAGNGPPGELPPPDDTVQQQQHGWYTPKNAMAFGMHPHDQHPDAGPVGAEPAPEPEQQQHGWDTAHISMAFGLHPHDKDPGNGGPPLGDQPSGLPTAPDKGGQQQQPQHQHGWDTAHNATAFGLHPHEHPDAVPPPGELPPPDDTAQQHQQHQHGWDTPKNAMAFGLHPHDQHPDAGPPPVGAEPAPEPEQLPPIDNGGLIQPLAIEQPTAGRDRAPTGGSGGGSGSGGVLLSPAMQRALVRKQSQQQIKAAPAFSSGVVLSPAMQRVLERKAAATAASQQAVRTQSIPHHGMAP